MANNSDIVFLSKTWISEQNDFTCDQLTPRTHTIHHVPRIGKPGGGVGIVTRNVLRSQPSENPKFETFESAAVRLKSRNTYVTAIVVYRPPGYVSEQFYSEFSCLLESYTLAKNKLIICGDFNIHIDNKSDQAAQKFTRILTDFGLVQHTHIPTHLSGHTLDLVITRSNDELMTDIPETHELFSDHFDVKFQYNSKNDNETPTFIKFRKLKNINVDDLKSELESLNSLDYKAHDLDSLLSVYTSTMQSALDKFAPMRTKRTKALTLKPWIDEEVIYERKLRRKCERHMLKTRNSDTVTKYREQRNRVNNLIEQKKIAFFHKSIADCSGDQKAIYQLIKKLANKPTTPIYPESFDDKTLADQFSQFFKTKIEKINALFSDNDVSQPTTVPGRTGNSRYDVFPYISTEELRKFIMSSPTKSCALDPIPTFLLKKCLDSALPILTEIVNRSLSTGYMPKSFKRAIVTPIPKKPKLAEFKNFRPISNLPFLSKIIERIVIEKLTSYCAENKLEEPFQSAYRRNHSCETALLEVANNILTNMDNQRVTLLTLLDLSAAFDTVPHDRFLTRLESDYGISGIALQWFASYFQDRYQSVIINDSLSNPQQLTTGMPQGSGTGPWGYTKYTGPLGVLIRILCILYHMFADDTQLHTSLDPNSRQSQLQAKTTIEITRCHKNPGPRGDYIAHRLRKLSTFWH